MNIKSTSIEAYNKIKASGLLSKLRFQVYEVIYFHQPITQNECIRQMVDVYKANQGSINTRFSELERLGVIESIGVRACTITGNNCHEYVTTSNLPGTLPKAKSRKDMKEAIQLLIKDARMSLLDDDFTSLQMNDKLTEISKRIDEL